MMLRDGSFRACGRCRGVTAQLPSANTRGGIALLLALFTLLCAICPLGLPASKKLGPTFNPANEAVTVRPDARLHVTRVSAETPEPRGPLPITLAAVPAIALAAPVGSAAAPATPHLASVAGASPFAARAPPARA